MNGRILGAWRLILAGAVVGLMVSAIVITGCGKDSASATDTGAMTKTKPDAKAPDFYAESLEGGNLALTDLVDDGKPMLITFGSSW